MRSWLTKLSIVTESTSPVNKLPLELLTEIFEFVLPPRCEHHEEWSITTVLLVCRLWHDLAVSSPTLWTSIAGNMPLQVLQVYLRRSCKSPLVVVARAETFGAPQDDLLSTLVPHFDRVGHLDIHGFQARSYVAYRMELLSSMHIQDRCDSDSLEQELVIHDDHFPALKSLTLVTLEARPRIVGTLSSLTSLALRGVAFYTWDELFCFLGSCPALEDLVIERFGIFSEWSRAEDPVRLTRDRPIIELQHLRELYCAPRWDHETITFLLANLSLPSTAKIGILMYLDFENEECADILAMGQSVDLPESTVIAGIVPEDKTFLPIFPAIRAVQTRIVRVGSDLSNSIVQVKASAMDDDLHIGGTSVTFTTGYVTDAFNPRSVQG
ncbi:hypothetical protein EVJ58_g9831 [Rhodofomes roseus]|uniref:F-box domain-containing protein n=1 Tax=Rhodofomes roseus TaxID=34475 RepID=A0A4Y9XRK9_9APHY|nr:hypothetical protein EVJ58_g9831 [Rhodofomes roseus]